MIRVSATLNKKVPLPGVQYGSQGFGGSLEVEVADSASADEVKKRLHDLYAVLNAAVNAEIAALQPGNGGKSPAKAPSAQARPNGNGQHSRGNGNGRHVPATVAQVRAIHAICKDRGLNPADAVAEFGVDAPERLSVKQASELIDRLKALKTGQ
ncbi:MAG: hypothetical protein M5U26_11715 [Planctomycetota bacterium]|nr:hypothetical protein [Planctomycetota bacterium]